MTKKITPLCFFLFVFCYASLAQNVVVQSQNNTSCGIPNGWIQVTVDGNSSDYTFEWRKNGELLNPVTIMGGSSITALSSGNYALTITSIPNPSQIYTTQIMLQDQIELPQVSTQPTANTSCAVNANGTLAASVNGTVTDHTFAWYAGSSAEGSVIGNDPTLTGIESGTYTVKVTNVISSCSSVATNGVENDPAVPEVMVNATSNTNCGASPNGSLTASTEGSVLQYTFAWYAGPEAVGEAISTDATLSYVASAYYTVKVIDINSSCSATVTEQVADDCQNIIVESVDNTNCGEPNGAVSASVNNVTSGYTFQWYAGLSASGDVLATGAVVTGLPEGHYSVRVIKQSNSSEIGVAQVMVADARMLPAFTVDSNPNMSCGDLPNGSAIATITNGEAADYSFKWYDNAENEVGTSATLSHIGSGTYTAQVTNLTSSCSAMASINVTDEDPIIPTVTIATESNTNCFSSSPNGSLTATAEPEAQYTYEWYAGVNTSGETLATSATLSEVAGNTYTVKVVDASSGCSTVVSAMVTENCELVTGSESMNEKESNRIVSYYPNPATTKLNIVSKANAAVSLMDLHGTAIFKQNVSPAKDPMALDLSGVKPGMYVLRVREAKKTMHYQVIVK